MQVIRKDRVSKNIDGKDGSESFQATSNPFTPKGVVIAGDFVDSGKIGSPDAALNTVDYGYLVTPKLIGTGCSSHDLPPIFGYRVLVHGNGWGRKGNKICGGTVTAWKKDGWHQIGGEGKQWVAPIKAGERTMGGTFWRGWAGEPG